MKTKPTGGWDNELSPWKFPVACAKSTATKKGYEFNLSPKFLSELWDRQEGRCAYSGLKMHMPLTHSESRWEGKRSTPFIGSLDRLDNSKGYTKDNVHFVCLSLNYARGRWSGRIFKNFLNELVDCRTSGEVVELVDTTDLKSVGHK